MKNNALLSPPKLIVIGLLLVPGQVFAMVFGHGVLYKETNFRVISGGVIGLSPVEEEPGTV